MWLLQERLVALARSWDRFLRARARVPCRSEGREGRSLGSADDFGGGGDSWKRSCGANPMMTSSWSASDVSSGRLAPLSGSSSSVSQLPFSSKQVPSLPIAVHRIPASEFVEKSLWMRRMISHEPMWHGLGMTVLMIGQAVTSCSLSHHVHSSRSTASGIWNGRSS